jgi:riboflavin kinase/FMN adenylyltransferase
VQIISFHEFQDIKESVGVTIGNFDGVHLGHQQQIKILVEKCTDQRLKSLVITYRPHPLFVIKKDLENYLIQDYEIRNRHLEQLGVDYICEIQFDDRIMKMSAQDFLAQLTENKLVSLFLIGPDFALGSGKQDSTQILKVICNEKGIELIQGKSYEIDESRVSSSKIRELLLKGNVKEASNYLGRNFKAYGQITSGKGKGKTIGFATANIKLNKNNIYPTSGVYAAYSTVNSTTYKSAVNIGHAPTLGGHKERVIESHVFSEDLHLYDEYIEVEFVEMIRPEIKFESVDELKKQIQIDIKQIENILND